MRYAASDSRRGATGLSSHPDLADPDTWTRWIEAANPAALLVAIATRLATSGLRGRVGAEDVWQETLLRAWQARRGFTWSDTPSFRRWLLRIAENCITDLLRHETAERRDFRRHVVPVDPPAGSSHPAVEGAEPWSSTTPSRVAEERERAARMRAALELVPEDLREIVRLRLFEELLIEEIAARLALGVSAVRHRFRKGADCYFAHLRALESGGSSAPTI